MSSAQMDPGRDQEYFLAIEALFIELRGAPLLLSPEDWRMAKEWREQGIPVAIVKQGIGEVFEERKAKGKAGRVNSLRYCRGAVEKAWRHWREINATTRTDSAEPLDLSGKLEDLARALPPKLTGREAVAARIRALDGPLDEVEKDLAILDEEVLGALAESLDPQERASLDGELIASLERLALRVSRAHANAVEDTLRKQLLRRRFEIPILSLFSS